MDPESVAFQPRDDYWRFQSEMLRVQQSQAELSDRVARLERKQDDDSRLKNVWGTSSPFPSVLGGTPQQVPLQQPTAEHFSNFDDDQSSNLIGNLQLDADDEPRRVGTTSRANSVRFDETANHGHWAHASRTSLELLPRSGSSLGGHALNLHLIDHLGFQDQITQNDDGCRKIKLTVYLPEAVPVSASAQSDSPAPQLPSLTVDFTVVDEYDLSKPKAIQILVGSDLLRSHNADILFSTNHLMIYDDDRSKLQVPLVRPEDENAFKSLSTSHGSRHVLKPGSIPKSAVVGPPPSVESKVKFLDSAPTETTSAQKPRESATANSSEDGGSSGRRSLDQRPSLTTGFTRPEPKDTQLSSPATGVPRSGLSPAMLSSWRRDANEKTSGGSLDWANVGKTTASPSSQPRREIKVLRPSRSSSRTFSSSTTAAGTGQSRFFDDGKRKDDGEVTTGAPAPSLSRTVSGEKDENRPPAAKPRSANPVGGASAFAWLKSGSK
ncbi:hypothetical protein N0V87_004089 [Didymella glomerata]|uniref:Ubiquitin carboxyl-terminal hydrolase 19 n=1 Tax=Didymella glomerata TaxID=749621 RepID=A0A9W9C167_9PLEO|nr:hypothetical protein N0V87_004089 [Didymella glomerata]